MRFIIVLLIVTGLLACGNASRQFAENTVGAAAEAELQPLDSRTAVVLAQLAYCSNPQKQLSALLPGWKVAWYPRAINSNHAFVASNGKQWAISIRGSLMEFSWHAFDNWVNQDLNILTQVDWAYSTENGARISQGMHNSFNNLLQLRDTITNLSLPEFLKKNLKKTSPLLITGHSLGGSLATVLGSYLHHEWKPASHAIEIVSFASPAAGNNAFVVDFDNKFPRMTRVEAEGDLVSKFPCSDKIREFAGYCNPLPSADSVSVEYKGVRVSLRRALEMSSLAMSLLEFKNGGGFEQVSGNGKQIKIEALPSPTAPTIDQWFLAARYQHGIAQYAKAMGAPVVECE